MTRIVERLSDVPKDGLTVHFKIYRDASDGGAVFGFVSWIGETDEETNAVFVETDFTVPVREAFLQALALCEEREAAALWIDDPHGFFPPDRRPIREISDE